MGTWGSGNLDSDGALDEVAERYSALIETTWARLQDPSSWEADECTHDALFVDLETMVALEDAGVFNWWNLPNPDVVDSAVATWLGGWADYFPSLGPSEGFMAERRAVIERTFARFREICLKYHGMRS